MSHTPAIPVVAGLIRNSRGQILLTRRLPGSHQGGTWEYPGGKIIPGETPHEALTRELTEELGIRISSSTQVASTLHRYLEKTVQLSLRVIDSYYGSPLGREGQDLRWLAADEIKNVDMAAADRAFDLAVTLPDYYVISGPAADLRNFSTSLQTVLRTGYKLVQMRIPGLAGSELQSLATSAASLCLEHGARLMLNEHAGLAATIAGAGVHLKAEQLLRIKDRPLAPDRPVAASCHNEEEIARACDLGLDFICVSPVLHTPSHPAAAVLGWQRFERLCALSSLPVYALGGLSVNNFTEARECGAIGVAGISGFWNGQ
jgi:8-oxo-dGTP diphosphatase